MPGIIFGRSSAKRIADGIRKVENLPGGEQDLQRRRAGGLGRSTLWEVTAVQTGPGTVTIKRVSNIAFDLNDPSEKEDILYDPNNEPAVEDRGLLIRLGEGDLFFFRRAVPDVDLAVVEFNEYAYIRPSTPDTTFGYPGKAHMFTSSGLVSGNDRIGIIKLASTIPGTAAAFTHIILGWIDMFKCDTFKTLQGSTSALFRIKVLKITQDFDASTITYNVYSGLSKTQIAVHEWWNINGVVTAGSTAEFITGLNSGVANSESHDIAIIFGSPGGYYNMNLQNARGLGLELDIGTVIGDSRSMTFRLEKAGADPNTPSNARGAVIRAWT